MKAKETSQIPTQGIYFKSWTKNSPLKIPETINIKVGFVRALNLQWLKAESLGWSESQKVAPECTSLQLRAASSVPWHWASGAKYGAVKLIKVNEGSFTHTTVDSSAWKYVIYNHDTILRDWAHRVSTFILIGPL